MYKFSELLRDLIEDCKEQGYDLDDMSIALKNEYTRIQNERREPRNHGQSKRIN